MLSTNTSFLPGKRDRNFFEGYATCSICYEEKKISESVIHKNSDEKILHAAFCSLECVKQFVVHARESAGKFACPVCRDEVLLINDDPIFQSCDVEYLKDQIGIALLKDDFFTAETLQSILKSQFCDDYLNIEKIAPEALEKNQTKVIEYLINALEKLETKPSDRLLFAMLSLCFSKNKELQKNLWDRAVNCFGKYIDTVIDNQKYQDVFRETFINYNKICALKNIDINYNAKIFVSFLKRFPKRSIEVDAEIFHLVTADCLKRQGCDDFVDFVELCQKDLASLIIQDDQKDYNGIDTVLIQDATNSLMLCAIALKNPSLIDFLVKKFEYSKSDFECFFAIEEKKDQSDENTLKNIQIFKQKIADFNFSQ